jgi:hypothetical protein
MVTTSKRHRSTGSSSLRRHLAVLGLATIGALSGATALSAVQAAPAGALVPCPWYQPFCNNTPPTTPRPPVADPGGGVLDPGTADPVPPTTQPPATPPTQPPAHGNGNNGNGNGNNGQQGGAVNPGNGAPVATPETPVADVTAEVDAEPTSDDDGSDFPVLPVIAGVALIGAAGTGLYLRHASRA